MDCSARGRGSARDSNVHDSLGNASGSPVIGPGSAGRAPRDSPQGMSHVTTGSPCGAWLPMRPVPWPSDLPRLSTPSREKLI
jgi:hypothetical protein